MTEQRLITLNKNLQQFNRDNNLEDSILVFLVKDDKGGVGIQFTNVNKDTTLINLTDLIIFYLSNDNRKKLYEGILK